ncbi:MAG: phosphomannomutase [Pseudomonadota bacterium]|jgi:phosphomannomutase/phosphoglucomutase
MSGHIYREYDIRGVADRDLTDPVVEGIGRGLAQMLGTGSPPRVVVGQDCRESGPRIFDALTRGLLSGGASVVNVGVGPTPLVYFGVHELSADGGVMITGSHNPGDENGLKIMQGKLSFFGEDIQKLSQLVSSGSYKTPSSRGELSSQDISERYLERLTSDIAIGDASTRFVLDAGNGAAGPLGVAALRRVGLSPVELFTDMDGTFPNHHPDPTLPETLESLRKAMAEHDAVVGLAFDGDGDRLGVVDRTGEIIWGDRLLALFARYALPKHPGAKVIGDVKCSTVLFDDIRRSGGEAVMWKTGHSLIKAKMKESRAILAGEMSGHFFFADRYLGFDDGIYAALRVMEIVSQERKTVGELLADLPSPYVTPELRVDCPDDTKFEVVRRVREHFLAEGANVLDIDGVRVSYEDGSWGLVRASNTSPKLILRFEAPSAARRDALHAETAQLVETLRNSIS